MSAEVRLNECRTALQARGVKDVKFMFGSVDGKPISELASDVAEALEAVQRGDYSPLPPLGDSVRG